ncbi:MAG TPA: inositol monophosphatase family protein [Nitrososphaerales archaeon]|nr:inositol monophosphatase family protein [Nitrososphaerales archaeon]
MSDNSSNRDWIALLRKAASAGKEAILRNYDDHGNRSAIVGRGAGGDLTLKIDEAGESAIHSSLNEDLGKDSYIFVSEELGEVSTERGATGNGNRAVPIVLCDPLDGSHNAQWGIPLFSISLSVLGLSRKINRGDKRLFRDVDVGLVLSVPTQDEFSAVRGKGSHHNQRRLVPRTTQYRRFETLLIECGDANYFQGLAAKLSDDYVYKTRLLGSAAISFCLLAAGSADGFIFVQPGGARTIDSPAGYLIAREAGCVFSELSPHAGDIEDIEVGFDSRLNLIGGANESALSLLKSRVC